MYVSRCFFRLELLRGLNIDRVDQIYVSFRFRYIDGFASRMM